ncbi:Metallo-dependent phosphatase [Lepidopterella palustris CBS 459.81]|uniref:Purple acid phosphatase n=1 Tax=Lepidopterella palustris CBS 459.81 TaxID=1314670 RepID=A0A8E2JIK7_9PEZI|nr:Metallo-dependent phosphatase [Lepidopterella palustris CBS 459.81]
MSSLIKSLALLAFVSTVSAAPAPSCNNATAPMQVRLAYAGDRGMRVSWNTYGQLPKPSVKWGKDIDHLNHEDFSDVSITYPSSTTYNNHVLVNHLEPDTLYYYLPQCATTPSTFRTSRKRGDGKPYTFAVVVDLGTMGPDGLSTTTGKGAANPLKPGEINTIQSLAQYKSGFDFLWHPGDIAYADAWLKEEIGGYLPKTTTAGGAAVYERILNDFYDEMTVVTSEKPYMVGPGNHEANCDNGGTTDKTNNITYTYSICVAGQTNFTGLINHFRMPSEESRGLSNFWYSFDHGMVHYVQINTETDFGNGILAPDEPGGSGKENAGPFGRYPNEQIDWLENDLKSVDRKKTPWVIVAGHRPWYLSGTTCLPCQQAFEPLITKYGVDLVLNGHSHVYERQAPLQNGIIDPAGLNNPAAPWYITNGAAGHYDGLDTLPATLQPYTKFALDTVYGWSRFTVHNCTHLTHEFVASANGSVLDTATLFKNRKCELDD